MTGQGRERERERERERVSQWGEAGAISHGIKPKVEGQTDGRTATFFDDNDDDDDDPGNRGV